MQDTPIIRFPLLRVLAGTLGIGVAIGVASTAVASVVVPAAVPAVFWGVVATAILGVLSVLPIARVAHRGHQMVLGAFFVGAAIRVVGCLLAITIGIRVYEMSAAPLVVPMLLTYLGQLAVETAIVHRFIRDTHWPTASRPSAPPATEPAT